MKQQKKVGITLTIGSTTYTQRQLATLAKVSKQSIAEIARRLISKATRSAHEQGTR